jgi:hypothetical protein
MIEVDRETGAVLSGEYPPRCSVCGGPRGEIIVEIVRPSLSKEIM